MIRSPIGSPPCWIVRSASMARHPDGLTHGAHSSIVSGSAYRKSVGRVPEDGAAVRRVVQPGLEFNYARSPVAGLDRLNLGGDHGLAGRGAVRVGRPGWIEGSTVAPIGVSGLSHTANATGVARVRADVRGDEFLGAYRRLPTCSPLSGRLTRCPDGPSKHLFPDLKTARVAISVDAQRSAGAVGDPHVPASQDG